MEAPDDLLRCGDCKLVRYCGRPCQKGDFKIHRHECQLLQSFQELYPDLEPGGTLLRKVGTFRGVVENAMEEGTISQRGKEFWERTQKFLTHTRVCSVCGKNAFELDSAEWINCSTCKFGWCCSQKHFDEYKNKHSEEICDKYVQSVAVHKFLWSHAKNNNEEFLYAPETLRDEPMQQFPTNWDQYFQMRDPEYFQFSQEGRLPPEFLPASTQELSQPLTCLYAMYLHGIDRFKDETTLTVHVVGASPTYEICPSCVWEELLHCLPAVKKLRLVFVGPDACSNAIDGHYESDDSGCCPTCESQDRSRGTYIYGLTYHDYKASIMFKSPDLIVAFNTGMHEVCTESWKTSLEVILDMNVPALFTSYNKDEAVQDYALLTSLNASMLTNAPVLNPMRTAYPVIEGCTHEDIFYHQNMYCMAFKGRA